MHSVISNNYLYFEASCALQFVCTIPYRRARLAQRLFSIEAECTREQKYLAFYLDIFLKRQRSEALYALSCKSSCPKLDFLWVEHGHKFLSVTIDNEQI